MTLAAPQSPCINICSLDPNGYCLGCCRTIDEIARWGSMTAGEQWSVLDRVAERNRGASRPEMTKLETE